MFFRLDRYLRRLHNKYSVISVFRSYPSPVQNGGPNGTTTMSCASSQGENKTRVIIAVSLHKNSQTIPLIQCKRNVRALYLITTTAGWDKAARDSQ